MGESFDWEREVAEWEIRERQDVEWVPLTHCGSWYSDRYYADDLSGYDAAMAAMARVEANSPGTYGVFMVRRFFR